MTHNEWILLGLAIWLTLILLGTSTWIIFWPRSFIRMFLSHAASDFTNATYYRKGQPPIRIRL